MNTLEIAAAAGVPAIKTIVPFRHQDDRGFFSEVWREDALLIAGLDVRFVQDNHVLSRAAGTVRGLHFQIGESAQAKLVRCPRGSILDVAVDIRRGSLTFGHHVAIVLSAANWKQAYVPVGFAHGYCTLEPDTEVMYKVTAYYDPKAERGLAWDDPGLAIGWPVSAGQVALAAKDRTYPTLAELPDFFPFAEYPD